MKRWTLVLVAFVIGLAGGFFLAVAGTQTCLDRRDYAPGRNTYRLVSCDEMPSYRDEAKKWSGN